VKEYEKYDKKTKDEAGVIHASNKFKKYTHKSSLTGESYDIDVGYERFLGPEMFFHPVIKTILKLVLGIRSLRLEGSLR
jgi:actin-related protein 3